MNSSNLDLSNDKDWLKITDDSDAIERIKQHLLDLEFPHLTKVFSSLSRMYYIDEMTFARIERHRPRVLSHLSKFLDAAKISDEGVNAAALLCSLREKPGRDYACAVLKAGDLDQCERLLYMLLQDHCQIVHNNWDDYQAFLIEDKEFVPLLLRLLEDPDPRTDVYAVRLCGKLQIPRINAHLLRLLRSGHSSFAGLVSLLKWLSEHEPTEEILQHFLKALNEWKAIEKFLLFDITDAIFGGFLRADNETVKSKARQTFMDLVSGWLNDGDGQLAGLPLGGSWDALCESIEDRELSWLRSVVQKVNGLHAFAPLFALIRLDPDAGRKILLDWLHQRNKREAGLRVARDVYYATSDPEIISVIQSLAANVGSKFLWWIFNTLDQIGGPAAYQAIDSQLNRLDPTDAERFRRRDTEYETSQLLEAVAESGVMHPQAVCRLSAWWTEVGGERPKTSTLRSMFSVADSEVFFDPYEMKGSSGVEESPTRCSWESLSDAVSRDIQRFAEASCGTFCPDISFAECQQTPDQISGQSYLVTFIHKNNLYQAEFMRPRDVGRIKAMINAALKKAGAREQFVEVAAIRPERAFVFAKPEILKSLASRFKMPLEEGDDERFPLGLPLKHSGAEHSES